MHIRAKVCSVTGKTTHLQGASKPGAIEIAELPDPVAVEVVEENSAFYLLRLNGVGQCIADTWHETVEAAKAQANFEYGIEEADWSEVESHD